MVLGTATVMTVAADRTGMAQRADLREAIRPGRGAVAGVAAYVVGYLVTYVLTSGPIRNSPASQLVDLVSDGVATWKLVGWVFYSAQWVDVTVPGLLGGENAVDLVTTFEALPGYLRLIAPAALLLAGVALGWRASSLGQGAPRGAAAAIGYLPLAIVGAVLVGITIGDGGAGPDLVAAGAIGAGLALVLGAFGGTLAAAATGGR